MENWSRNEVIALLGLVVGMIGCFATVAVVPEFRELAGLTDLPQASPAGESIPADEPIRGISEVQTSGLSDDRATDEEVSQGDSSDPTPSSDAEQEITEGKTLQDRGQEGLSELEGPTHGISPSDIDRLGQLLRRQAERRRHQGWVQFSVTPLDAFTYVDGRPVGVSQDLARGLWLTEGEHDLAIIRKGYGSLGMSILVRAKKRHHFNADLGPRTTASQH
jgi:hypothetical protein